MDKPDSCLPRPAHAWQAFVPLLFAASGVLFAGCGKGYTTVPVSGTITRNGQSLPNVVVTFQPVTGGEKADPGPGSVGHTDENGKYVLKLQSEDVKEMGAVPGKHRVTLFPADAGQSTKTDEAVGVDPTRIVPEPYLSKGVSFSVPEGGTDKADFDVAKPPPQ